MGWVPSYETVGQPADKTLLLVHGILGSARNWRGFSRDLLESMPGWRAVLVDLRHHGESSPTDGSPSTVTQCACDLIALEGSLGSRFDWVAGHSFGGKVVLSYLEQGAQPDRAMLLDSPPGSSAEQASAERVLDDLRSIELPIDSRSELVETMVAKGYSAGVAHWMTTNLEREGDGFRWRFDLDGVGALLTDYGRRDLWEVIEEPEHCVPIELVRGLQSDAWAPDQLQKLDDAERAGLVEVHELEAGHWLHHDDADGLAAVILGPIHRPSS